MRDINKSRYKRSANFSYREKLELVELVAKYRDIIENKRTDSASVKEKDDAWNIILEEFNSSPFHMKRDSKQIRMCYGNLKRRLKRECTAGEKVDSLSSIQYGGNLPKLPNVRDKLLSILQPPTFQLLQCEFDSDDTRQNDHTYTTVCKKEKPDPLQYGTLVEVTDVSITSLLSKESNVPFTTLCSQDEQVEVSRVSAEPLQTPIADVPGEDAACKDEETSGLPASLCTAPVDLPSSRRCSEELTINSTASACSEVTSGSVSPSCSAALKSDAPRAPLNCCCHQSEKGTPVVTDGEHKTQETVASKSQYYNVKKRIALREHRVKMKILQAEYEIKMAELRKINNNNC